MTPMTRHFQTLALLVTAVVLGTGTARAQQPDSAARADSIRDDSLWHARLRKMTGARDTTAQAPVPPAAAPAAAPGAVVPAAPTVAPLVQADTGNKARTDSIERARTARLRFLADSVEKARLDSLRRYELQAVVVTATRLSMVDERAPVQVEPLDVPMIIPTPDAAPKALLNLPGVNTFDDQGTPFQPEIEVRGFTLSPVVGQPQGIGVFLNGVRMNEPDAQEVNFDLLPMQAVSASSLVRGSNVLFGRNSLGGTLLLTTRRGGTKPQGDISWGMGSFGEQTLSLSGGGKAGGIDGFIAATGTNELGWRQITEGRTRNVFATIGHQWGATHDSGDVALDILYGKDHIEEAGSLPDTYAALYPRLNYTGGDFFAPESHTITLRGNQPVGGGIFRATLFNRVNNYEQYNANVPPPNTDNFIDLTSNGATIEWTKAVRIWKPTGLTIGAEYQSDNIHFHLMSVGGDLPDSGQTTTLAEITPQTNAGAYAQAIVTLSPKLNVTGGIRLDHVNIPYVDQLNDSNSATNTYTRVSPEVGLNYQASHDFRFYLGFRSGFRAPAALELACASPTAPCSLPSALGADPTLQPVTTQDFEGGFDVDLPHSSGLDVNAFLTNVDNDIQFAAPNLTQVYFINVPQTRRMGVEITGQIGIGGGLSLTGSYSYIAATYQSSVQIATADTAPAPTQPGDIFPNSPLHRWRAGASFNRQFGRFSFDGDFNFKGYSSIYVQGDESNQRPQVPGYSIASIEGSLTFGRINVRFEVENLFNSTYSAYGIEAQNSLFPVGSRIALGDESVPVVPFLTPGLPRRFTLTFGARL